MATSLEKSLIRTGSDYSDGEFRICEPCFVEGQTFTADRFCADCQQYLCKRCSTHHRSLNVTRKHTLLSLDVDVRQTSTSETTDKCSQKCTEHKDKRVKFYCEAHSSLGCSACIATDHKQCSNTIYIHTAAADLENNDNFKQFYKNLRQLGVAFQVSIEDLDNVLTQGHTDETGLKHAFTTLRKQLNDAVDKLEDDITAKVQTIKREETVKLTALSNELEALQNDVNALIKNVDDLLRTDKHCDAYVTMKKQESQLVRWNDTLESLTKYKTYRQNEFRPNSTILKHENIGALISQTVNISWRSSTVPALQQRLDECALSDTSKTEKVNTTPSTPAEPEDSDPDIDWHAMCRSITVGTRVRRGKDWPKGHDEDRGGLGTVICEAGRNFAGRPFCWRVKWDNGRVERAYQMGKMLFGKETCQLQIVNYHP